MSDKTNPPDVKSHHDEFVWLESYKTCACTFVAKRRRDLPGYCQRHATDRRGNPVKLPAKKFTGALGYAGNG